MQGAAPARTTLPRRSGGEERARIRLRKFATYQLMVRYKVSSYEAGACVRACAWEVLVIELLLHLVVNINFVEGEAHLYLHVC